jgi:hypothetical protein
MKRSKPSASAARLFRVALGLLLLAAGRADAQQPARQPRIDSKAAQAITAAQMVGIREPLAFLVMRSEAKDTLGWVFEPEPEPDLAPPLNENLLSRIKDNKPLPDLRGRLRDEWKPWEAASYDLFNQALRQAALTPPEAFAKSATENKYVTWGDMFREPWKYRGKVIPVKGRLKMLRRRDAPVPLQREGFDHFYEGWVFTPTRGANPVCLNFAKLPPGLEEGETLDQQVQFNGYFLMRYRYHTSEGHHKQRDTLLFIAPTVDLQEADRHRAMLPALPGFVLAGMVILVAMTILIVLGMGWRFRRGDRLHQARLGQVRANLFGGSDLAGDSPPGETITTIRPESPPQHGPGPT